MNLFKVTIITILLFSASNVFATGSAKSASQASKHAALSLAHGAVFSTKIVAGVVAVPLIVVGSLGAASKSAGSALLTHATEETPLTISEVTITADPAPQVIMNKDKE
jgi:hypothetical protein